MFLLALPLMCLFGVVSSIALDALFTGHWHAWFVDGERRFGLTFTGFLSGCIIFIPLYGRLTGLGALSLMNDFLPPLALAQGIGRVGCFLGGCCYGKPWSHGFSYPPGSFPFSTVGDIPLFPIQLVESILLLGLFCGLMSIQRRFRAFFYIVSASAIRFFIEHFRYDERGSVFGIVLFSPQQLVSLVLIVVFGALLILQNRRPKWA